MYNLLEQYIDLLHNYQENQAFIDVGTRTNMQNELRHLEWVLVKWIIENNINIKTTPVPQRLAYLVQAKIKQLNYLEHIQNNVSNLQESHLLNINKINDALHANFQETVMDFVAIQNYHNNSKKNVVQKLQILGFTNLQ